jgi:hypothetical protein
VATRGKSSKSPKRSKQPARPVSDFRTILALAMVVVASLGAILADRTAQVEFNSAVKERRLGQGQMLELQYRQALLDLSNKRAEFDRRRERLIREARVASEAAAEIRKRGSDADLNEASVLELRAQEQQFRARLYTVFNTVLIDTKEEGVSKEDQLSKRVLPKLQFLGFRVNQNGMSAESTAPPSDAPPGAGSREDTRPEELDSSIWRSDIREILSFHEITPTLAWEVFLSVIALFFLVLADLFIARARIAAGCAAAGFATALGCVAYVSLTDPPLRTTMLAISLGSIVLGFAAWRLGLFRWIESGEHHVDPLHPEIGGFPGIHMTSREAEDKFSKAIVILLAATVVLSAWAGYSYSGAAAKVSEASLEGFAQQVEMIKRSTRPTAEVLGDFDGMVDALERRVECAAVRQQIALIEQKQIRTDEAPLQARKDTACAASAMLAYRGARQNLEGPEGIDSDPYFPFTYYSDSTSGEANSPLLSFARWDGDTQIALFWSSKATSFLTILTLCAIALFLFGQALGIGASRLAGLLVVAACAFVCYAIFLTATTWHRASEELTATIPPSCHLPAALHLPETPVEVAAHFFADGKRIVDNANSGNDYKDAVDALACAVKVRPNFALALFYYATARALEGSPQANQSYVTMQNAEALEDVVANRKAALDSLNNYGYAAPSSALNSYGASLWHFAVIKGHPDALDRSLVAYRQAIEAGRREHGEDPRSRAAPKGLTGSQLLPYLNIGLSYLTKLQFAEARSWFKDALDAGAANNWTLVTSFLTTFEVLEANCGHLHPAAECEKLKHEIDLTKAGLVSGSFAPAPANRHARVEDAAARISPDLIRWGLHFDNFDPVKDSLVVVWYVADALPEAAGSHGRTFGPWRSLPDTGGHINVARMTEPDKSGRRYFTESYLWSDDSESCLAAGKYRAEFYVNGALALSQNFPMRFDGFDVTRWHDVNVSLCRPASWRPWRRSAPGGSDFDLVRGLETKDGAPAVFAFVFFSPADLPTAVSREDYFLERAQQYLRDAGVLGADSHPALATVHDACAGALSAGDLIVKTWISYEGWVHVALVFADAMSPDQACDVGQSLYDM